MQNFLIIYTTEHSKFKDFCKKKKGGISISYVDLLTTQEKYMVLEDEKSCNKVLECELFVKIFSSLKTIKENPKYHTILYFSDTLDFNIIDDFSDTILSYKQRIGIPELSLSIMPLDELDQGLEECVEKLTNEKQINLLNKEYIHQIF